MIQLTPRKWIIQNANDDYTRYQIELEGWGIIMQVEDTSDQPLGNARLIANAREMFRALEAIESAFADGSLTFTTKRRADSDAYHLANVLMTRALARVREE